MQIFSQSIATLEAGSFFLCPLAVQTALDALSLGAAGDTLKELNASSGLSAPSRVYWNLLNRLQSKPYIHMQREISLRDPIINAIQRTASNNLKTTFKESNDDDIKVSTIVNINVEWAQLFTAAGTEPFGKDSSLVEMMQAIVSIRVREGTKSIDVAAYISRVDLAMEKLVG